MRPVLQNILIILIAVIFTGNLAIPHICVDDDNAVTKIEQQIKAAPDNHKNEANADDHCCMAHHCCVAKLPNAGQQISIAMTIRKIKLLALAEDYFSSLDFKGLDRPPKFFA
ncbi:MAG TPA: hypothetical protein ACFYEF_00070 [Candidatus Wunengus sp. YC63]|uniref:hypothetical protein n=1 Tax=Candidatus Wunengus sp. YC63 TaxID=3367699 RepID=UPI004026E526